MLENEGLKAFEEIIDCGDWGGFNIRNSQKYKQVILALKINEKTVVENQVIKIIKQHLDEDVHFELKYHDQIDWWTLHLIQENAKFLICDGFGEGTYQLLKEGLQL